jgi:hypothetical protein
VVEECAAEEVHEDAEEPVQTIELDLMGLGTDGVYHVIRNSDTACLGRSPRFQELDVAH